MSRAFALDLWKVKGRRAARSRHTRVERDCAHLEIRASNLRRVPSIYTRAPAPHPPCIPPTFDARAQQARHVCGVHCGAGDVAARRVAQGTALRYELRA